MLSSDDYLTQKEAIESAYNFKDPQVVDELIKLFIKTDNRMIEEHITEALKQIGGGYAVEKLLKLLAHEEARVRVFAFEVLCEIGNDNLQAIIAEANNPDKNVRKFIVDILGALRNKEAVLTLLEKLSDDDVNVVQGAVEALGNIGDIEALKKVIEFLPSAHLWVQWAIIESIKKANQSELVSKMLKLPWEVEDIIFGSVFDIVKENGRVENIEDTIRLYLKLASHLRVKVLETIYAIYIKSEKRKVEEILGKSKLFEEMKGVLIYGDEEQKYYLFKYLAEVEDGDFVSFIRSHIFDEAVRLSAIELYYMANAARKRELIKVFKYFNKSRLAEYIEEILKGDDNILKLNALKIMRQNGIREVSYILPDLLKNEQIMSEVLKTIIELDLGELFEQVYEEYFNLNDEDLKILMLECMVELRPQEPKVIALIKSELENEILNDSQILRLMQLIRKVNNRETFEAQLKCFIEHPNVEIVVEAQELLRIQEFQGEGKGAC